MDSRLPADERVGDRPLIVFAGGGTGGHIYPALAVRDALLQRRADLRFAFFITERAVDRQILADESISLIPQTVQPFTLHPLRIPRFYVNWRRSRLLCRASFARNRPAVVLGTGGFGSGPAIREAQAAGIPTAMLNPDVVPGRANKHLSRYVDLVLAQWEDSRTFFPANTRLEVSGCPIRPEFSQVRRKAGRLSMGLDAKKKTLLVTGASLGARSINEAFLHLLDRLSKLRSWQCLHLTGKADFDVVRRAYAKYWPSSDVLISTDRMPDAIAAADLIVSRAGASTLAEITAVGRPSVLMPYPYHRDQHQLANAKVLARAGAARIVSDRKSGRLNAVQLAEVLSNLMRDDEALEQMSTAARALGKPNAAAFVADCLCELGQIQPNKATVKTQAPATLAS